MFVLFSLLAINWQSSVADNIQTITKIIRGKMFSLYDLRLRDEQWSCTSVDITWILGQNKMVKQTVLKETV